MKLARREKRKIFHDHFSRTCASSLRIREIHKCSREFAIQFVLNDTRTHTIKSVFFPGTWNANRNAFTKLRHL